MVHLLCSKYCSYSTHSFCTKLFSENVKLCVLGYELRKRVSKIFWHCIQGKQIFIGYHSNHCQGKFSSIHIKVFFILMLFLQTKTFSEAWNMRYFSCRFSTVYISIATGPKIWTYTNIFLWFCKFQFYIYILTNIQGCVVLFAQNILF